MFESEFERNLFALRQDKLRQISALGQPAYPSQFLASHTLAEVRQKFGEIPPDVLEAERPKVTVAGRIMAIRAQGKAGFAQLQQGGERLQIYVRLDAVGETAFQLYKLLDLGDHIGVSGYVFRTRTGELTVHVDTITFLTKAMLALPEKYHGLADVELRYRQRYVDLFMNTDVRAVFVKRAQVLKALRSFFDARGYLYILDRKKDMIKPGGENVYSPEVESMIASHPEVLEVAVIGLPDDTWGEAIKAAVVCRPGSALTEAELIDYCRERMAHFKCPTSVDFMDALPKGGTGKVQKTVLRDRYRIL